MPNFEYLGHERPYQRHDMDAVFVDQFSQNLYS
jgi:hypothetical protein